MNKAKFFVYRQMEDDSTFRRHSIGSSLFLQGNIGEPVNTNFSESFAEIENGAPKYKFEPSLNFCFKFLLESK
jgi:hypothetical protein